MELSKAKFPFGYSELISHRFASWEYHACLANIKTHRCFHHFVVSFAAVFWMSRNAPPFFGGALRDIQKTAAKETNHFGATNYLT